MVLWFEYYIDGMLIIKKEREHSLFNLCVYYFKAGSVKVMTLYCYFYYVWYVTLFTRLYGKRSFSKVTAAGYMHLAYTLGL